MRCLRTGVMGAVLIVAAGAAAAQTGRPAPAAVPVPPTPPAAPPTNVASEPQQTTASFGDWLLRCTRTGAAAPFCELAQGISSQDRTVAQLAFGRVAKGQPLIFTVLVPPSVSLPAAPSLVTGRDGDTAALDLTWRRCLPGGCIADAAVGDDALRRIRGWTEPARVTFTDAAGKPVALPFSARGLPQALDALAKSEAG